MKARPLTLVALHGNGGGAFRFERIKPHLPADISFQAVTLPGFADKPADPALRTLRDYAAYLQTILAAEPRPLIVLGHGIGGSLALEFAQHFAAQIDGLILHAPVGTRLESRFLPRLMALPGAKALGQWLFSARLARPLFKRLLFSRPVPADILDRFFDEYRRCAVFGQMFDLITPAWFRSLRPVDLPIALLWGERERVLTVDQLRDYHTLCPHAIIRTVPGWDHFPMIEQPQEYAQEIVKLARKLAV
ncbi:MAG: alpha/beta hydrolase [Anaerolineae bacterium]|nr:alpha/beta hydrolase [Anaerolineae bacterium]